MTSPRQRERRREAARDAVRAVVRDGAIALFLRQGYAATTVDQVASAAGLSRRSFFRYFSGKDEILTAELDAAGARLAEELRRRPASEPDWRSLRRCFDLAVLSDLREQPQALALAQMVAAHRELSALHQLHKAAWARDLAAVLGERRPGGPGGVAGRLPVPPGRAPLEDLALGAAAVAAFEAAHQAWLDSGGAEDPGVLLDRAMSAVHPLDGP